MTLLQVRGLTVQAGARVPVQDLSFDLAAGERLGLIGESGSGKSLTAQALLGLLDRRMQVSGSVLLDGQEVVGRPEAELVALRGPVATMVFQEPLTALDPLMPVGRQVAEPVQRQARRAGRRLSQAEVQAAVRDLLGRVALPDHARIAQAYPHELSGGQRQRIAIARALAARPRVLLADEPVSALDLSTRIVIVDLLRELARDLTLVLVSHDLAVVAALCTDMIVLDRGLIVEAGPVRRVIDAPAHPYTRRLLDSLPRMPAP
jgi:peptide/nickel transport system ATP-binding protein